MKHSRNLALACLVVLVGIAPADAADNAPGNVFVPIAPCRLFDTRPGAIQLGPRSIPLLQGESMRQPVIGRNGNCFIPPGVTAIAMNVTVTNATTASFLTVWPGGQTRPLASSLNWVAGMTIANKVDVGLGAGAIDVFNNAGSVDVLADVVGYYEAPHTIVTGFTEQTIGRMIGHDGSARTDPITNCVSALFGNTLWMPIVIPVGATITGFGGVAIDDFAGEYLVATLRWSDDLATAGAIGKWDTNADAPSSAKAQHFVATEPFTVAPQQELFVEVQMSIADLPALSLCNVQVTYTQPR